MSLDPELSAKISKAVADGFDAQIAFTQDLVRFPSTRGNEHTVQDYMARAMLERGLVLDRFEMDHAAIARHPGASQISEHHSEAPIVVGIHRPENETGRSLILQGHVDVVPTGPEDMWTTAPFDPVVKDGWMYGRGAGDMKAGVASNLFALDALRRTGLQPAATLYVQSVVEEESTGNGALMTHLRGYKADAALVPEPMGENVTRANVGVLWFQVEVRGVPAHVAYMGEGANAIDAAYRVVGALRELEARWNEAVPNDPWFGETDHPLNLNVGRIHGGDWASSVPSWCKVDLRISMLPGTSAEAARKEVEACISDFARSDSFLSNNPPRTTFNGFTAEGYVLEPGSDAEDVLSRGHEAVMGRPMTPSTETAYLDSRVYALYDKIPALNYGPIAENIHGVDERVDLASLKRTTEVTARFIAEWCGVEPARDRN